MAWFFILMGILFIIGAGISLFALRERPIEVPNQYVGMVNNFDSARVKAGKPWTLDRAKSQYELIAELNNVGGLLVQRIELELQATLANERLLEAGVTAMQQRERDDADHKAYLALANNKVKMAEMAAEHGTTPEIMAMTILEQARRETKESEEKRKLDLEIDTERRKKEVELDHQIKVWEHKIKVGHESKSLSQHKKDRLIQGYIDEIYEEIEEIKKSKRSKETQKRMITDREDIIKKWRNGSA